MESTKIYPHGTPFALRILELEISHFKLGHFKKGSAQSRSQNRRVATATHKRDHIGPTPDDPGLFTPARI